MQTFPTMISAFINYCKYEKNLSPKTLKAYTIDLTQLTNFFIEKQLSMNIEDVTKIELRAYMESISCLKPKSKKRKVATIKAMFNYLEFEDKILSNPLRKMRIKIKEERLLPIVMEIDEIKKIFRNAYQNVKPRNKTTPYAYFESLRTVVVIEMLFATGARVSEISDLREKDVNLYSGSVTLKGKGNRERIIQICNNETLQIMNVYKQFRGKYSKNEEYFLINRFGKKLSDQSIRNMIKHISKKAGVNKPITPHKFRHTVATLLLENDVDIKYIQAILGHSSIMTTQIYTHVNREKQRQILTTKHPRKFFSMTAS